MPVDKKIYEYLAQQIIQDYGITKGRCLDVGTGQGNMGLELAQRTELQVYLLDIKTDSLDIALKSAEDAGLQSRVSIIKSAVEQMPFIDNYFDLVVSRGSVFFWQSQTEGFKETLRVLCPGGVAYIGGGASRLMPQAERETFFQWARPRHKDSIPNWDKVTSELYLKECLGNAGVPDYKVIKENGTWIEIRK